MSDQFSDPTQHLGAGDPGLVDDLLGDGQQGQEPRGREPADDLTGTQDRASVGGLKPIIKRKRKEFDELQGKIRNHRETKAYQAKSDDGRVYFDNVSFQEDQAQLIHLNMEIQDLKERDQKIETTAQTRRQTATRLAEQFLARELPRVREGMRQPVREAFAAIFRSMTEQNQWAQSAYADRNAIITVLNQIFDTAFGHAMRNAKNQGPDATNQGSPAPAGYDEGDDPKPRKQGEEEEEDDFTNNLLYAMEKVADKRVSVAEMRRRENRAREGAKE